MQTAKKQKLQFISLLGVFALLLMPVGKAQGSEAAVSSLPSVKIQRYAVKVAETKSQYNLAVSAQPTQQSFGSGCVAVSVGGALVVQNGSSLNLNQPANCFSLSTKVISEAAAYSISVSNEKAIAYRITVTDLKTSSISAFAFKKAPISTEVPVLPSLAYLTAVGFVFAFTRIKQRTALVLSEFKTSLTLEQLQVMRC